MTILEEILQSKREEVRRRVERYPVKLLEESIYFASPCVSLKKYLTRSDKHGIIAEIKRRSPSLGAINENISVEKLSIGYMQAGASALSVLTDKKYFGGTNDDLFTARKYNYCPILRKDFVVDEYQIVEAKSIGADAILLIAAALQPAEIQQLATFARSLGLEVLLEVHTLDELNRSLCDEVSCVGVNNRDLATFTTDLATSFQLAEKIPSTFVKVAESGLRTANDIAELKKVGFSGFLIGERFMATADPAKACARFIQTLEPVAQ